MVQAGGYALNKQAEYKILERLSVPDGGYRDYVETIHRKWAKEAFDRSGINCVGEAAGILSKGLLWWVRVGTHHHFNCSADFLKSVKDKEELMQRLQQPSTWRVAGKAVMNQLKEPFDGFRGAAIGAKKRWIYQRCRAMRAALEGAKTALAKRPRYVGVLLERSWREVDSGGQGLVFSSMKRFLVSLLTGKFHVSKSSKQHLQLCRKMINANTTSPSCWSCRATEDIKLGYCTEIIMVALNKRPTLCQRLRLRWIP